MQVHPNPVGLQHQLRTDHTNPTPEPGGLSNGDSPLRNQIQDVLWVGQEPTIWEKTRRDLACALDIHDLVAHHDRFEAMLDRWWVLGTPSPFEGIFPEDDTSTLAQVFGPNCDSARLRKEIDRHVFRVFRNSDWSVERLFDELGGFDAVDRRFAGFLEELVSHKVIISEDTQRRIVETISPHLREAHLELREVALEGGYPVFRLIGVGKSTARPKSLLFGSAQKPDLRLSSTVDNEIEIVESANALVFDNVIGSEGLRWRDLQAWWRRQNPECAAGGFHNKVGGRRKCGSVSVEFAAPKGDDRGRSGAVGGAARSRRVLHAAAGA